MRYVLSREQAKALDAFAMQTAGVPSLALMEEAAMALAQEAEAMLPAGGRALAVCGNGNNRADGLAALRILAARGYRTCAALVSGVTGSAEFEAQLACLPAMGTEVKTGLAPEDVSGADLVIDAVFGIGLTRPVEGEQRRAVELMNAGDVPVLAADIPSGVDGSTGAVLGCAVRAAKTVTFGPEKIGLLQYPGAELAGSIVRAPLCYTAEMISAAQPGYFCLEKEDLKALPARPQGGHKGTFGRVLVIAGQKNMAGASVLCARAAMRAGAGLVRVLAPEDNRLILQTALPEAVVGTYVPETFSVEDVKEMLAWADVIVMGPGLGSGGHVRALLNYVLQYTKVPLVLDADALNAIAREPGLLALAAGRAVLTPHPGEMARLCGLDAKTVTEKRAVLAESFARENGVVLLLKGARSLIARPSGPVCVNLTGNSGMASGGSGDVLTGVIGGLVAGGADLFDGACLGAMACGLAGEAAAQTVGERAMLASDQLDGLARVFREAEETWK
ncbi:MAG: NAD(P)H-hydrate dehydratase [Lachnospiraceae bacterium]|nr:NAD(P)H-hydrate dehydratase [Lachnospiraceae bacterium]